MSKNFRLMLILAMAVVIFVSACQSSPTPNAQPPESPTAIPTASPTESPQEAVMDSEEPYPPPPIAVYNPYPGPSEGVLEWSEWEQAVVVIKSGDVVEVYQVATLHVTLVLGDGGVVLAKEPEFGEVFRIIEECGDPCKAIVDKSE